MTAPAVYGCHNRAPLVQFRWVQDGWEWNNRDNTRAAQMKQIAETMTPDCQYTKTELGQVDARCAGCKWLADAGAE